MESKNGFKWSDGLAYEAYVGRWSRFVAEQFLAWLDIPLNSSWLDLGCGTGVLIRSIIKLASPAKIFGIDRSTGYVMYARHEAHHQETHFLVGDVLNLPLVENSCDVGVSGLVLNFITNPQKAVEEMKRAVGSGGQVAVYVWDYAGGMQMIRHFWDAAVSLDPQAARYDEGLIFPICKHEALANLFNSTGFREVEVRAFDIPTHFKDFNDYWSPFLRGQGPAPGYVRMLDEKQRIALMERIRLSLPVAQDGSIHLWARAWGVRGKSEI